MKKDKEWLKNKIKDEEYNLKYVYDNFVPYEKVLIADDVYDLINQLDEPEVNQLDKKIKELDSYNDELIRDNNQLRNQLDEPRKPVIPQFVAVWIEETKKQSKSLVFAITHIYDNNEIGKSPNKEEKRIFQWMELADNEEVFARAWLDGYEMEKEQKYQVIIRDGEYIRLYLCKHGNNVIIGTNDNYIEKCPEVTYLTEQEIKTIDERFWAFAEEVME